MQKYIAWLAAPLAVLLAWVWLSGGAVEARSKLEGVQQDSVTSADILDGTIVDADISGSAAIADTKLATLSTAGKVADTALSSNIPLKNAANTFTAAQTLAPGTDAVSLTLKRGTDTSPTANLLTIRNNANTADLFAINASGKITTGSADAGLIASGTVGVANKGVRPLERCLDHHGFGFPTPSIT